MTFRLYGIRNTSNAHSTIQLVSDLYLLLGRYELHQLQLSLPLHTQWGRHKLLPPDLPNNVKGKNHIYIIF